MEILIYFLIRTLSTLSLIQPSYTIRATIFEKVFRPKKFPKTDSLLHILLPPLTYCSVCLSVLLFFIGLIASLLRREGKQAIKNKTDRQTEQ